MKDVYFTDILQTEWKPPCDLYTAIRLAERFYTDLRPGDEDPDQHVVIGPQSTEAAFQSLHIKQYRVLDRLSWGWKKVIFFNLKERISWQQHWMLQLNVPKMLPSLRVTTLKSWYNNCVTYNHNSNYHRKIVVNVWIVTSTLEIWPWVKAMTVPWVMDNNYLECHPYPR